MVMKNIVILSAASILAVSCDYVSAPTTVGGPGPITGDTLQRTALIEEFTGHTCSNCAAAAGTVENILNAYPEKVVAIAIHHGWFAEPCPPHPLPNGAPQGSFNLDLRCPEAAAYETVYSLAGAPPVAMVNRLGYPNNHGKSQGAWAGLVDSLVNATPQVWLKINHTYNATTRALDVNVDGQFLQTLTGDYNIVLMLTESSITGWQVDGSNYLSNFEFKHVLRSCLNTPGSIIGSSIATGTTAAGTAFNYTLPAAYTIPANFDPAHCEIVAYVYETNTKEAIQAVSKHVE
jgi:Outer membrane protein Omp28